MDPNAWLQFIQRALQSTETLSFLIVGMAMGGIGGFFLGRWSSSHAILMKQFEGDRTKRETVASNEPMPIMQIPTRSSPEPGLDPSTDPVSEALWKKVEEYLKTRGIKIPELLNLKAAMATSGKKIMNSDNRQSIMLWSDGSGCHPVAMIWRAGKNPRVFFPDGTETNVPNDQLEEITGKF